jgi:hypothetical protein
MQHSRLEETLLEFRPLLKQRVARKDLAQTLQVRNPRDVGDV